MLGPSIEELREISANEAEKRANAPRVLTSTRFMEVRTTNGEWVLINVSHIDLVQTFKGKTYIGLVSMQGDPGIAVEHSYTDIKNALKQFFR